MDIAIVGVDCAVQEKKVGLALGFFCDGKVHIQEVTIGSAEKSVVETLTMWVTATSTSLIALDAPLGWPTALGHMLASHWAGTPIRVEPNQMFRRLTDRVVKREIGKQPLDVGADRIARTAHAALQLLDALRQRTGRGIDLAWEPPGGEGTYAIEVYPAATLIGYDIEALGYKGKQGHAARGRIVHSLQEYVVLTDDVALLVQDDNALDAVICVLAGADFLRGESVAPDDLQTAQKEGWIWFRKSKQ